MKNTRLVFENRVNGHLIPNAMPTYLKKRLTEHAIKHDNVEGFREIFESEFGQPTFPYAATWDIGWITNEVDLLSDLSSASDDYITSNQVYYLFYIGTAGNIEFGLNPSDTDSDSDIIKTSYFENLSSTVIDYTKTKNNFFIYISNLQEGISYNIVDEIYKQATKLNIPLNKIVLQSDSADFQEIKNKLEKEYKTNIDLKYIMYSWALPLSAEYIQQLQEKNNIFTNFKTNRKNKVVCLNRRLKDYRLTTISFLLGMGYENMYLSYDIDWCDDVSKYYNFLTLNSYEKEFKDTLNKGFEIFKATKKRKADDIDDAFDKVYFDDAKMYEDSYFSIVTESEWYAKQRITEKITKAFINHHPFVVVGPYKTLELLKFYGFKTFSEFWNEDYDNIKNPQDRFLAITKVIDKLMNLSTEEWDILTKKIQPILIHNRKCLENFKQTKVRDKFLQNILSLLENKLTNSYYSIL